MKYLYLFFIFLTSLQASIGEVTALHGHATLTRGTQTLPVRTGTKLETHDQIQTDKASKLQMRFNDNTVISLGAKSKFQVDDYLFTKNDVRAKFTVKRGFFKSITGKIGKIAPSHFKVKTANATIGVRGTTIIGETTPKFDMIACTYGQIVVTTAQGSVVVNQGERTVVAREKAPLKAQKVNHILLKQLDQKSDPAVAPIPESTPAPVPVASQTPAAKETKTEAKEQQKSEETTEQITATPTLDDIKSVVGTDKPVYEGRVTEGKTSYGEILQNSDNRVRLGFDLGDGSVEGNLRFDDPVQNYDIDVAGHVKGDGSFAFNSQNGYDGGGKGKLEGNKYENANGDFRFEEKTFFNLKKNIIEGKFETSRQHP